MCAQIDKQHSGIKTVHSFVHYRSRKKQLYVYAFIAAIIAFCWSLPRNLYENIQKHVVELYSALYSKKVDSPLDALPKDIENMSLRERVHILEECLHANKLSHSTPHMFPEILSPYFRNLILSRVIYRDPSYWGSSIWVNSGKSQKIQKNSPVLSGNVLVGLVDYVGEQQSRIRLITDVGMQPSVVAIRGGIQLVVIKDLVENLKQHIENLSDIYLLEKDKYEKIDQLNDLLSSLNCHEDNVFLLRGTLSGNGGPLWKEETSVLHGEGFCMVKGQYLRKGDILVTTGLDGIFPPGLLVAEVTHVNQPREGACSYEIKARSLARDIAHLSSVLILPPMEFNPNDRPDIFGLLWD
ncbi:hypothetical protein BOKEGFJH_00776 [Chlamydia avium]|uniref:Cell shape-determining protein MreC n=1 Tax=Chlamydia avium 10DC88 TaxID=1229831 RepID=W8JS64_9CHLA|nr:rod shape-determining protein MreC [Chlamydia avium]AHK63653.1 Rod shape-determining MreC family protein [Chlamydia avium 10DC88]VVT43238.1 hypothetical protein BOKEGFJH_00776 [Chlamydia avium]